MTAHPHLTHSAFVDLVTHISEVVCLERGWTLPVPFAPNVRTPSLALVPPLHVPEVIRMRSPHIVEPGF
jgi:hypothetical protein